MKYQAENAVSSFFYYMWNAWSKEECKVVFGGDYLHFWEKWNAQAENSIYGAAERFYTELSECSRTLLVERAVSLYDGKAFRKEPDDCDGKWCEECEENVDFCSLEEFKQIMQSWWTGNDIRTLEGITGLKETDYLSNNSSQTFAGATDKWWYNLDYDGKRNVYNKHTSNNE